MVVAVKVDAQSDILVRKLQEDDRTGWEVLWHGYLAHLRTKVPDTSIQETWRKLMDDTTPLYGLVAMSDSFRMAGLVHVSFSPSSWSKGPLCQVQDLFVDENLRGQGAGHRLIDAVFNLADQQKSSQVFWHLNRSDFRAKLLFDAYNVGPEGQIVQVRRKLSR